jgi:RsiW-degrading membrane proteinase PrsW (M82 family)
MRAIEAAHGMAALFWIIYTIISTQLFLLIINTLHVQPEVWWWKIASIIINLFVMVMIATLLYRIIHYAMGLKPVKYLVRFTSLTALPFWRRYTSKKKNNTNVNSDSPVIIKKL